MSIAEHIQAEFTKPANLDEELSKLIDASKLDLSQNIPDPQMLVSKEDLPVCTRGNFSFVIGLPGARKSFLCTGIAGAFLNEDGCMGLDNPNGTGTLLWIDTEQAAGHVAKIGRRLHRIAGLPTNENSNRIHIHLLREFAPEVRRQIFLGCVDLYRPDFIVLDGVSDLISDPNNAEQASSIMTDLMRLTKEYDCHLLTVIHANVGSEKARGHLGSEALRKCETAILVKADSEVSVCKWAKTRDRQPEEFAFSIAEGLPVVAEWKGKAEKTDVLAQCVKEVMPEYPNTINYSSLVEAITQKAGIKPRAAKDRITNATSKGLIMKNEAGMYHLPQESINEEQLLF